MSSIRDATQVVCDLAHGDARAADRLIPMIYDELRNLAARCLAGERPDHTLQPTALVNEVYLSLVDSSRVEWRGRAQFLSLAASQIRRILVDHARRSGAAKRGGGLARKITLSGAPAPDAQDPVDLLTLEEALSSLAARSPRQARIVELRYFGGLSVDETAAVLDIGPSTVKDDWSVARAFLHREMSRGDES